MHNVEYQLIDLLSEDAYDCPQSSIDMVIAGDMIYDEVLTESLCRVLYVIKDELLVAQLYPIKISLLLYYRW